ncbi:hypothetical protein E8E12_000406 [Didymella heteroderae]|uniref:Uncharacterized protein n=1 Tax=Didymella heteroderae TaxID=1769908 RepID=A0A9P4WG37_9PLEO|nr:hypothetical protein E8E12_000406 [Didymella heteroderae]
MHAATIITSLLAVVAGTAAACACKKVSNAGLYCGYCAAVTDLGSGGVYNAYWCNKKGGCEDLGYSKTRCEKDTTIYCDGRDKWRRDYKVEEAVEDLVEVKFEG